MSEYTIPMKVKNTHFKPCGECKRKKFSVIFYQVWDNGLNECMEYHVCRKCMKEAKERQRIINKEA